MTRYGLCGEVSRDLLSHDGRVLVHDNRAEMEFLFIGARVVELPRDIPEDQTLPIKFHPELAHIRWPLDRRIFR